MTKPFQIVSNKNDHLNANDEFFKSLFSKLITYFYKQFHFGNEI